MLEDVNVLADDELIKNISDVDCIAMELKYHRICRTLYSNKAKAAIATTTAKMVCESRKEKEMRRRNAIQATNDLVQEAVIINEEIMRFEDIVQHYSNSLLEFGFDDETTSSFAQNPRRYEIRDRLNDHLKDGIRFAEHRVPGVGEIVFKSTLSFEKALETPLWSGFNAKVIKDPNVKQKVAYLPQINASPTSNDVVLATMKMAQQLRKEVGQSYMLVTYDLAIAKMALAIQAEESPRFGDLFIQLGSFHILLSNFKSIGMYVEESGGPYILTECGVLASGSIRGFLAGKKL